MIRQIRVIMSLAAEGMMGGVRNLISLFSDFGNIITGLRHAFDMASAAARGLWDMFVQGAINEQRLATQMKFLSGSAEISAAIMERLDDWTVQTGSDTQDAEAAILDLAKALKATDGSVDPDKLFRTMDLLKRFSIVTGMSMSEMSRVFSRALTGDVEMLARTLGISREQLARLSPEFAKFAENVQGAGETQLGEVTRLGEQTGEMAGDALTALEQLATALGVSSADVDEYAGTVEGQLNSLKSVWDNFTEDVGRELLPIISEALEKILNFVTEHKEDIQKFVEGFGNFSSAEWIELTEALEKVDWQAISKTVTDIANFIGMLSRLSPNSVIPGTENSPVANFLENTFNPTKGTVGGPGQAGANAAGGFSDLFNAPAAQGALGADFLAVLSDLRDVLAQGIGVQVSVDGEANISAAINNVADQHLTDLVTATTNSKSKNPTSPR